VAVIDIGGIEVPDSRPLFLAALAVHVIAGLVSVIAGARAALARKRPGWHPRAGRVYLVGISGIFLTASIMAAMRWRQDRHLFVIAVVAVSLAGTGLAARRRAWARWPAWHGASMGGSYITLLTGFYVDNGPQLPPIDRLPHVAYWVGPAAIGIPIIVAALVHNGALRSPWRRVSERASP
jgi:hypothetical protein